MASQDSTQIATFLNILPDALIAIDKTGVIVMSNTQADELFGYTHEEMAQLHIDMLLPERFRAAHARHRARYFLAPQARLMGSGLRLYGLRKDGTEIPVDIALRPVGGENNMAALAVIRDVTAMNSLTSRVEQLAAILQEKTLAPVLELAHRIGNVEQRMDIYDGKLTEMQIKITEVSDATKANQIVLADIQENMKTLESINAGIDGLKKLTKQAFLWIGGIMAGAASLALATIIINYFSHH